MGESNTNIFGAVIIIIIILLILRYYIIKAHVVKCKYALKSVDGKPRTYPPIYTIRSVDQPTHDIEVFDGRSATPLLLKMSSLGEFYEVNKNGIAKQGHGYAKIKIPLLNYFPKPGSYINMYFMKTENGKPVEISVGILEYVSLEEYTEQPTTQPTTQ